MMRFLRILFVIFFSSVVADAVESYPVYYKYNELLEGGKMIVSKSKSGAIVSYLIKPSWAGESETISVWDGIKSSKIKGTSLNGVNIISAYPSDNVLLVIWEENRKYYLAAIDKHVNILSVVEILYPTGTEILGNAKVQWISLIPYSAKLMLFNGILYLCTIHKNKIVSLKYISSNVSAATALNHNQGNDFSFVRNNGSWSEICFCKVEDKEKLSARLQLSEDISLYPYGKELAVVSTNKYSDNSWLHIVNPDKGVLSKNLIMANGRLAYIFQRNGLSYLCYLNYNNLTYRFSLFVFNDNKVNLISNIHLTLGLIEAKRIYYENGNIFILFRNGLFSLNWLGNIQSLDYFPFGEYFEEAPDLALIDNYLILSSPTSSIILKKFENRFWWFDRFISTTGKVILPVILILLIFYIFRKYRIQKRLLKSVLELPSSGVVFVLDKRGRLRSVNHSGKEMLGIKEDVPMRRVFQYYCDPDKTKSLKELANKATNLRTGFKQKIDIIEDTIVKEWYFTIELLQSITGTPKGYVLTGVDITEELERKRLKNLSQLAHDMQTSLSTIRLNAEQLDCAQDNVNQERRRKIIHQVVLLIQRVRDIITVGRTNLPELQSVNAAEICIEVRNEFDDSMFPNIKFDVESKDIFITCDKAKMIRALRNAVENGIRAIKDKNGIIIISNKADNRYSYFSVKDNGSGMDAEKKKMMMTPYFSTSKTEGGAGIGTMIIQNVIEQHGGTLKVISEPGEGTEIIMSIPNFDRNSKSDNNE